MLYLLYGNDFKKSREKLHSMIGSLLKKKPDASFFKLDSSNFLEAQLDEFISSQGLFERKYIVQMDGLLEDLKTRDFVMNKIKEISESENIFVFIEENITKSILKKTEKVAQKIQEFKTNKKEEGRKVGVVGERGLDLGEFNIFDLADALGRKDKKNLWILYQKAKIRNISDEEIQGIFVWQIKSILISEKAKDIGKSGLKSFIYNKSLRFAKNFKEGELEKLSSELISIYHDARRGIIEFDIALEKFVLDL